MPSKRVLAKNSLGLMTRLSGLSQSFIKLRSDYLRIINYHQVRPYQPEFRMYDLWVSPETFENQIKWLKRRFNIISLRDLRSAISSDFRLPKNSAMITFDDGAKDFYDFAYPILQKWRVPATMFLVAGYINQYSNFWWDRLNYAISMTEVQEVYLSQSNVYSLMNEEKRRQAYREISKLMFSINSNERERFLDSLEEQLKCSLTNCRTVLNSRELKTLRNSGLITFGSHSLTHPGMVYLTRDEIRHEIAESKRVLERELQCDIDFFCYPGGFYNDYTHKVVRESGYIGSMITENTLNQLGRLDSFALGRISISGTDSWSTFICKVSGVYGLLYRQKKGMVSSQ